MGGNPPKKIQDIEPFNYELLRLIGEKLNYKICINIIKTGFLVII